MKANLSDPWFEAEFVSNVTPDGTFSRQDSIEGAQGLFLYCPCKFGQDDNAHGLIVCFANPRNAAPAPDTFPDPDRERRGGGKNPRWTMTGNTLDDLTLQPSIAVGGERECWHGYITDGKTT